MSSPLIIGIAGGTGSGKTTLARRLAKEFSEEAVLLSMDNYYKHMPEVPFDERVKMNYDHPDLFDIDLLVDHLTRHKKGETIYHPTYNFVTYLRNEEMIPLPADKIVLLEGILAFVDPRVVDLLDIKIFVDTDADLRFIRRLKRDMRDRGRSLQSVVDQYITTVKPMHDLFIEPSKRHADIIVPQGGKNEVAVSMIVDAISSKLHDACQL